MKLGEGEGENDRYYKIYTRKGYVVFSIRSDRKIIEVFIFILQCENKTMDKKKKNTHSILVFAALRKKKKSPNVFLECFPYDILR